MTHRDLRPTQLVRLERFSPDDKKLLHDAFEFAKERHTGQERLEGGPYYTHLVAVAQLGIDELDADAQTAAAALLHDVVEDTPTTLAEIEERFGEPVRFLVDALTEVGKGEGEAPIADKEERVRLTWEKVHRYAQRDPRVYRIKIADRWHNLMTSQTLRAKTQMRWVKEVRDRCIPLCRELGFGAAAEQLQREIVHVIERVR
jgi:GTP diphosphokinase / guanosine-3',5'-bis(diphosphate) 3'-diphosphatase